MDNCFNNNLVPLNKAVSAALIDTYADHGKSYQMYAHWAARRFKSLARQSLRLSKRYAKLHVNKNTYTATLPADFRRELFIGYINDKGYKVPLPLRTQFTNESVINTTDCEDACPKCKQSKSICDELTITESEEVVIIEGNPYIITTIKKLYSNGNYYLEKAIPYFNTVTAAVEYTVIKEFITALDLKECGCLETTTENIDKIRCCCPEVYGNYYAPCWSECDLGIGGYRMLEEAGLIQLDRRFTATELYIEYTGFLPKINGQLAIPEVAFECVVKGTVVDAISGKQNVNLGFIQLHEQRYKSSRSAMDKELGMIGLDSIMQSISLIPKFDVSYRFRMDICGSNVSVTTINKAISNTSCETSTADCERQKYLAPFEIAFKVGVSVGAPIVNTYTYQNDDLIGAVQLNNIIIDNNNETELYGDFTFDSTTGIITRTNPWQPGTVAIIPFAKLV